MLRNLPMHDLSLLAVGAFVGFVAGAIVVAVARRPRGYTLDFTGMGRRQ